MEHLLEAGGTRLAMPRATWKRLERELAADLQLTDRPRLRLALDARQHIRDAMTLHPEAATLTIFFPTGQATAIRAALDRMPATGRANGGMA